MYTHRYLPHFPNRKPVISFFHLVFFLFLFFLSSLIFVHLSPSLPSPLPPSYEIKMAHQTAALKRLTQELKELHRSPSANYTAEPLQDNIFEWHFTIRGPTDTEFQGGIYHGNQRYTCRNRENLRDKCVSSGATPRSNTVIPRKIYKAMIK